MILDCWCVPDEVDPDTGDGYRVLFTCGIELHGDGDWRVGAREHTCPDVSNEVQEPPVLSLIGGGSGRRSAQRHTSTAPTNEPVSHHRAEAPGLLAQQEPIQ